MSSNNRSVLRAITVLKAFQKKDEWLSISEMSRRSALPFSSTHRVLQSLIQLGAVEKSQTGGYRLGFLIASMAQGVNIDDCLLQACLSSMTALSKSQKVSVFLGRLQGNMVVFLGSVGRENAKSGTQGGTQQTAAYGLALGRVLLAELKAEELGEIFSTHAFVPLTRHTITDKARLLKELDIIRKQGFAVEREEAYTGFGCVAVPIRDDEGRVIASIAASEEVAKLTHERVSALHSEMTKLMPVIRRKILFPVNGDSGLPAKVVN